MLPNEVSPSPPLPFLALTGIHLFFESILEIKDPFNVHSVQVGAGLVCGIIYLAHLVAATRKHPFNGYTWAAVVLMNSVTMVCILFVMISFLAAQFVPSWSDHLVESLDRDSVTGTTWEGGIKNENCNPEGPRAVS